MGRLLIIDDSATDRLFIKKALLKQQKTLELIELEQGKDAVSIIKTHKPKATILDIRMPGMDGFDVLRMIRQDVDIKDHPVFMVSGSEEPGDINMANAVGANGYLTKPESISGYQALAETIHSQIFG